MTEARTSYEGESILKSLDQGFPQRTTGQYPGGDQRLQWSADRPWRKFVSLVLEPFEGTNCNIMEETII